MSLRVTEDDLATLRAKTGKPGSVTASLPVTKRNKHGAVKKDIDGLTFASTGEAWHYASLRLRAQTHEITELRMQVPFSLDVNGVHICEYIADFTYMHGGVFVVEDFKGYKTRLYELKKKLMLACHGIAINEIRKRR